MPNENGPVDSSEMPDPRANDISATRAALTRFPIDPRHLPSFWRLELFGPNGEIVETHDLAFREKDEAVVLLAVENVFEGRYSAAQDAEPFLARAVASW